MRVPLLSLGLSQIYISQQKLDAVLAWFEPDLLKPLPVRDFGNSRLTLTDGHTRALAAYRAGMTHVPVEYDNDPLVTGEPGESLYREDIRWCERFGITDISALDDRVVSGEDYIRLWHRRCDRLYELFTRYPAGKRAEIAAMHPELYLYGADDGGFCFEDADGALWIDRCGVLCRESGGEASAGMARRHFSRDFSRSHDLPLR
ncbi:MAG: hypothetical protein IJY35_03550 [Clostridia bacterium]|nr:hypothetical protein [Clostridia bacterium]